MDSWHYCTLGMFLLLVNASVFCQVPVEYEPEFLEDLENHTVTQGRDVSFTCVVNHLGPYKVAWIKSDSKTILAIHTHLVAHNNRLSVTHNGHNTWRLKVANVQKNDSGTYMCQINTDPMKSQVGYLEVVVPPDILNEEGDQDHVAVEGGIVRLKCRATGVPDPKVVWKREDAKDIVIRNEQARKEVMKIYEGEVLQLSNVQRSDMGKYLCIASNGIPPSVAKRFIVQIHFHPMVKVSNQLVAAPIGSDVLIQCYVETSPKAMHSWYKNNDEKLMPGAKYEMEEVAINEYSLFMNLTIKVLERRDFGEYTCSSSNAMGKDQGMVRLQELHIPKTTMAPVVNVNDPHKGRKKPSVSHSKEAHGQRRRKKPLRGEASEELLSAPEGPTSTEPPPRTFPPTHKTPHTWTLHRNGGSPLLPGFLPLLPAVLPLLPAILPLLPPHLLL